MNDKLNELLTSQKELLHNIAVSENEIAKMDAENIPNVGKYNELLYGLSNYQNKLAAVNQSIQSIQEQTKEIEETSEVLLTEIDAELANVNGVNIRELIAALADPNQDQNPEVVYQFVASYIKEKVVDVATTHTIIAQSYKLELDSLQNVVNDMSKIKAEYEGMHKENLELSDLLADATSKRNAAATELAEVKQDNERLREDNKVLRERIETLSSNVSSYRGTAELAEQLKQKIKPIYNVRWEDDMKKTHYLAVLASSGEDIRIPHYAINSYRELEGEELARFLEEQEEIKLEQLAQEACNHTEVVAEVTPPSLPHPNAKVSSDSTNGEMVSEAETVTREEFNKLVDRVTHLEQQRAYVA